MAEQRIEGRGSGRSGVAAMFCPSCGAQIANGVRFCSSCGAQAPTALPGQVSMGGTTSAEEAAAAPAPPPPPDSRACVSSSFHGRTLRLTANGGRDSVDPNGFCCCLMPPPCLICCCAPHVRGTGSGTGVDGSDNAVRVRYDAPSGILTRVDGCAGKCGLHLQHDSFTGEVKPGQQIQSFRCGLTPCCAYKTAQFDIMSDGTIVPRKDHAVCVGFEKGKTVLVPVGHADACVFDVIRSRR
ncbi:MAG: zinc-ribbon domain-containing protein [Promethearchaeia archaeon]